MACHRYGQRDIHTHHTYLYMIREVTCRRTIARKNTGPVSVFMTIDYRHCLIDVLHPHNTQYGTKNFIAMNTHRFCNFIKQTATYEIPFLEAFNTQAPAIHYQVRTLIQPLLEIIIDSSQRIGAN